jgi:hypothetical protein
MRKLTAGRVDGIDLPPIRSWLSIGMQGAILGATPAAEGGERAALRCWRPAGDLSTSVEENVSPDVRPEVQLLPNQEWLYVRPVRGERNIRIYALDGTPVRDFFAGFSVRHCQSSTGGDIWVGYGDEGIFGPEQPGNAGLNCFDNHGNRVFRYDEFAERRNLPPVYGCYALNVSSDTDVWMYYYQSFSLVHLVDKDLAEFWPHNPSVWCTGDGDWKRQYSLAGHVRRLPSAAASAIGFAYSRRRRGAGFRWPGGGLSTRVWAWLVIVPRRRGQPVRD